MEHFFAVHTLDDVFCQCCNGKKQFTQRYRFLTYPKCLMVVLQRFVYDDWVPKKLEIEL
jgi:ubiquitin carboxyl-terminal hydrolase 5/13